MDDLYTVKEAAYECGVSEKTMRRWIDEGRIQASRVHPTQRLRVAGDEVDRARRPSRGQS